jgi:hypothetical protein
MLRNVLNIILTGFGFYYPGNHSGINRAERERNCVAKYLAAEGCEF